jgi:hypothetical protein
MSIALGARAFENERDNNGPAYRVAISVGQPTSYMVGVEIHPDSAMNREQGRGRIDHI